MPEWEDRVDKDYDFIHDEHSTHDVENRPHQYIWNTYSPEEWPIDGLLISREQVEESPSKAEKIRKSGIYNDDFLKLPKQLPTICDCGAWGYKDLPFPPYDNEEMLEFYEDMNVTTAVTIDHLVLGSGHTARLYLDERAFTGKISKKKDLPDELRDAVDIMVDEWPSPSDKDRAWPEYVKDEEPSIYGVETVEPFTEADFEGSAEDIIDRLSDDPRAVYREDDMQYRYDLTLRNAREMYDLYQKGYEEDGERKAYSFRLMSAVQGWSPESYADAVGDVLEMGFQYIGIGGVAGSSEKKVKAIVSNVGRRIKRFERENNTRIDTHVFGFAKTGAFETVGRSGMTSFDSASMLRAAWTGGSNYHLSSDERYDALRVRYASNRDTEKVGIQKALRGQEMLYALRAFDKNESIAKALQTWHEKACQSLDGIEEFLSDSRHDDCFDVKYLNVTESSFLGKYIYEDGKRTKLKYGEGYEYGNEFIANFGGPITRKIVKKLRADSAEDPLPFKEYEEILHPVYEIFEEWEPTLIDEIEQLEKEDDEYGKVDHIWPLVEAYATWEAIDDSRLLAKYRELLQERPWERCNCNICEGITAGDSEQRYDGIEVAIFRGNNRNRRRGFHNTKRFYNEFADALPKTLVVTKGSSELSNYDTIEAYLKAERPGFWEATHDLPVAEIGVVTATGFHEWWEKTPSSVSLDPDVMGETLTERCGRYQHLYVDGDAWAMEKELTETIGCPVSVHSSSTELRQEVIGTLGYEPWFTPPVIDDRRDGTDEPLRILIIDQCSKAKNTPDETDELTAEELASTSLDAIHADGGHQLTPARDLYAGRQQRYITEAVNKLRTHGDEVTREFISAGFGLVEETEELPPYNVTFANQKAAEIDASAERLQIQKDVLKRATSEFHDIVFFPLGTDYYRSMGLETVLDRIPESTLVVVFNNEELAAQFPNVVSISARTPDAKKHGSIVVSLKGTYLQNFADHRKSEKAVTSLDDIVEFCTSEFLKQTGLEQYK
ncbi:queuine tRNA-ribosyltransferase tRNA-guanine transglycosylase [Haladaptatus sp. ZSTT2]|uniref:queuine tRNA-ribosyltransferase tRNA-guanine transglycosylase n=1 Tax=Haladaptatus sp. ZSTT2 TaxID=3120515 RepID=UPI00300F2B07